MTHICVSEQIIMIMTSSNGNIFRVTVRSPVNSPHKGQWRGALMFTLICVWINGCVNNREAGDLRRYCAHYDVTVTIGSDDGLTPGRRQAIIWTNAVKLLFGPTGTNFSGISIEIYTFSFNKWPSEMSSGKCRPFCLGLNVLSCYFINVFI